MIELNPGHRFGLKEIGILKEDEKSITQEELLRRVLEKGSGKVTEQVIHFLRQEMSNRQLVFSDIETLIEDEGQELATIQEAVEVIEYALSSALVQFPLLLSSAHMIKEAVLHKNTLISRQSLEEMEGHISEMERISSIANTKMDQEGDFILKEYERMRKELLARGGRDTNPFNI